MEKALDMIKSAESSHVRGSQTLGQSISTVIISLCKILIFANYFFSPFDHWIIGDTSWRPILDSLPQKLDLPTWIQIPCFLVLVLSPSVIFSVATLLRSPCKNSVWPSHLLQTAAIGPIFLLLFTVVAVMVRSGSATTILEVESKTDQTTALPTNDPLTSLTITVIRIVLAGFTNTVLQSLSSAPPKSVQSNPLVFQTGLVAVLSFCKSKYAHKNLIALFQRLGLPLLQSPPPLTTKSLLSSLSIFVNDEQKSLITPVRWAVSYILVNLFPRLFSRPLLLFSTAQGFDVELRDSRDVFPSLSAKRGYRIGGDWTLWGVVCVAELTIRLVFPWLWKPLQQLNGTGAWFKNAAGNAKIVLDIATAMLRAAWASDWSAMENVASAAYRDHRYGVLCAGIYLVTIACAVLFGHCFQWFNAYLARRSTQL